MCRCLFSLFWCRKMRLALGCVLLLPAALHLLLCHAPAAAAPTDTDTHADNRHSTPLPPLDPSRHTRHDPLFRQGLLAGLPRLLSFTSQDAPLSNQLLGAQSLTPMQPYPSGSLTPLASPLQQTAVPQSIQDLQDIGSFPLNDFELLQALLDEGDGDSGRRRSISKEEAGREDSCRGNIPSEDVSCPSTLLQVSDNFVILVFARFRLRSN